MGIQVHISAFNTHPWVALLWFSLGDLKEGERLHPKAHWFPTTEGGGACASTNRKSCRRLLSLSVDRWGCNDFAWLTRHRLHHETIIAQKPSLLEEAVIHLLVMTNHTFRLDPQRQ